MNFLYCLYQRGYPFLFLGFKIFFLSWKFSVVSKIIFLHLLRLSWFCHLFCKHNVLYWFLYSEASLNFWDIPFGHDMIFFVLFFLVFLGPHCQHMGVHGWGWNGTSTCQSIPRHSNVGSELCLWPTPQLTEM